MATRAHKNINWPCAFYYNEYSYTMASNPIYSILWLILLCILAWPVAALCAGLWVVLMVRSIPYGIIIPTSTIILYFPHHHLSSLLLLLSSTAIWSVLRLHQRYYQSARGIHSLATGVRHVNQKLLIVVSCSIGCVIFRRGWRLWSDLGNVHTRS